MLRRNKRATTSHVRAVLQGGNTTHSEYFSLRTKKSEKDTVITVVVGKKVAAQAVARNTIKRRIKSILRNISLTPNIMHVLYVKKKALELSTKELKSEIQKLLA